MLREGDMLEWLSYGKLGIPLDDNVLIQMLH